MVSQAKPEFSISLEYCIRLMEQWWADALLSLNAAVLSESHREGAMQF